MTILKENKSMLKTDNVDKNTERAHKEKILSFLREKFEPEKDIKLDIRYLWGNFYRLNFWGKRDNDTIIIRNIIIDSKFVKVKDGENGLECEEIK